MKRLAAALFLARAPGAARMTLANTRGGLSWAIGGSGPIWPLYAGLPGQRDDLYARLDDTDGMVWREISNAPYDLAYRTPTGSGGRIARASPGSCTRN